MSISCHTQTAHNSAYIFTCVYIHSGGVSREQYNIPPDDPRMHSAIKLSFIFNEDALNWLLHASMLMFFPFSLLFGSWMRLELTAGHFHLNCRWNQWKLNTKLAFLKKCIFLSYIFHTLFFGGGAWIICFFSFDSKHLFNALFSSRKKIQILFWVFLFCIFLVGSQRLIFSACTL